MKGFLLTLFLIGILLIGISLEIGNWKLEIGIVNAQVPSPAPIPCSDPGKNPEFHSLRPYQASPCQSTMSTSAKFCGNNLILHDNITESYPGGGSCTEKGGTVTCTYNEPIERPVTIDLSGASLPFMGNTEDVPNSQPPTGPPLDDAEKMNGYVSWYLNGVINRAESGSEKNTDSNIVDFSGPINKLLPSIILDARRIEAIKNVDENKNHNQIVVCASKQILGLIGKTVPHECYSGNNSQAKEKVYRLKDWSSHLPPLPWDPKYANNQNGYLKARCEWTGGSYVTIPIINKSFCVDNPLNSNEWSDLYSYVPLSSTEDLKGSISIDSVSSATGLATGVKVSGVSFSEQKPAELFFSHMQEVSELGKTLQDTFVAGGEDQDQVGGSANAPSDVACISTEVRSNKGDDLFAKQIEGDLHYDAKFSCDFETKANLIRQAECEIVAGKTVCPSQTCSKDVYITLTTKSSSPKADEIWSRLVAGPTSVFRRLAPKVGPDGPIACILDIPGSTNISYRGSGVNMDAELNLPHLGGISAYFLEGIQTMLRPKGFGEQVITGQNCQNLICSSGKIGDLPDLPPAKESSCRLSSSSTLSTTDLSKLPTLVRMVEAAADAYKTPPRLILGVMYGEGVFNKGRYEWTEENVRSWSKGCATMPNCTPGIWPSQVVHYYEPYWESVKDAVKVVDPERESNPCNLMDNIFAIARDLHGNSGAPSFAGKSCFGIPLKTGAANPDSCSWGPSDIETAIKVWETGAQYMCVTKEGGCAEGGLGAVCPTGDTCETINGRYSNPSHNACVWDVAHGK